VKRHGFRPAALVMGLVLLALAAAFLLDASGAWDLSPRLSLPLAAGGLTIAGVSAVLAGRRQG
jgi:hypothetical protein